ncbi:MAG: serine/threonine-protein kinase [Cyanobacteria bacterium J06600_6]
MKGKILGSRYQVIEYVAEGGFGKTYLAQDTQLPNRDLCIVKQLSPSFDAPNLLKIARRLFKTEAAALHNLGHHPQIPLLLAYFEEAGKFYLVQQYIQGKTLAHELASGRIWSAERVIELLKDCLNILQFIHDQGVIHRDLKPANLIRRHTDHKIVLVDFGTVKNMLQGQGGLTKLTVAVGTQGYMPIEQARGKPRPTSDLYALGIICIQALTGIDPLKFEEDRNGEISWSHLTPVEPELKDILAKMIRYNAQERYQSARSVLNAIENCLDRQATPLVNTAIADNAVRINSKHLKVQLNEKSLPDRDLNALPGVRSVVIADYSPQKVKTKLFQQKWCQIALGIFILTSGVYLSLQASVFNSTPPLETNIAPK